VKTLIRDATLVLPGGLAQTNVLVEGSKIAAIDAAAHTRADDVVSARGLHLLPGVIDDQVHFREPGLTHKEDLYTATRACAKGGVTTFLEMPNTIPNTTMQTRLDEKLALAASKSLVNFGFYIGATPHNLAELKAATRTPGIKIFIGSSTGDLLVDDQASLEAIFAETTLPITAGFAIMRRRSLRHGGRWIWPGGTSIGFMCCMFRPATRPICWRSTATS